MSADQFNQNKGGGLSRDSGEGKPSESIAKSKVKGKKKKRSGVSGLEEGNGGTQKASTQADEPTDISMLQAFFKEVPLGTGDNANSKKPLRRPRLQFENTFKVDQKNPFVPSKVEGLINNILEDLLTGLRYCPKTASTFAANVAETIRNKVLNLNYDRYKYIVYVALGSMNRQGFCMGFKSLSDNTRDAYAHGSFSNPHLFVVASVHAIYYD